MNTKKPTLNEELKRIKNLFEYKYGSNIPILKEDVGDDAKEVKLQAKFDSGMWKEKSMPQQDMMAELKDAIKWLQEKSEIIKKSGGIVDGKSSILTVQIEAGESLVTNYDGEVKPKVAVESGYLAQKRARTIQNFLNRFFTNLKKEGKIGSIPVFEAPVIVIGTTKYEVGVDNPDDGKYKDEQYIKVKFKLTPPTACLTGLIIEVLYNKDPNPAFPCRGGHKCDDAIFKVLLNKVPLDGVANLNNYADGGSRSSKFVVTPEQALKIMGDKPKNIIISFQCNSDTTRCHSSTPEIRISKGGSVIYHACTPSISEENDYKEIELMELDPCGNIIKAGQDKKAAQKDEALMKPPADVKSALLVYDIATKTVKETTSPENMYTKYLPLYGYEAGGTPQIYKGNCNEGKIYGGWCLWSGFKINYVNDNFCEGVESRSLYKLGSESAINTDISKSLNQSIRNYRLDNCDTSKMESTEEDMIKVNSNNISNITFNVNRLYTPAGVYSTPPIIGSKMFTPFKLVPDAKPNNINFTPKLFVDFVNNIYGTEQTNINISTLTNLMTPSSISELSIGNGDILSFNIYTTDESLSSNLFPNSKKIDGYVAKYNTYKNEKFTGYISVGGFASKPNVYHHIGVSRVYGGGSFVKNKINVQVLIKDVYSSIVEKLKTLGLVKEKSGKVALTK